MIIRESCPGDLCGIIGSCRSGRVIFFYNPSFANLLPSIYHANAGAVRFPAIAMHRILNPAAGLRCKMLSTVIGGDPNGRRCIATLHDRLTHVQVRSRKPFRRTYKERSKASGLKESPRLAMYVLAIPAASRSSLGDPDRVIDVNPFMNSQPDLIAVGPGPGPGGEL